MTNNTQKTFGKLVPNLKHWEHSERVRIEIRAAQAVGDHSEVTRLAHKMRVNFAPEKRLNF